jgi:hypothetical protein
VKTVLLCVIAAALLAAVEVSLPSANPGIITVTAVYRETVDPSPGLAAYRFSVFDKDATNIGYEVIACWRVSQFSTLRQCAATLSLPKGKITLAGTLLKLAGFNLNVTGGDGVYLGAGGAMRQSLSGGDDRWAIKVVLT